jgi:hypothetical protein
MSTRSWRKSGTPVIVVLMVDLDQSPKDAANQPANQCSMSAM